LTAAALERTRRALVQGEIVLLETDTLWGLHALATADGAASRLAALKGHAPGRPYLLLVHSVEAALGLGHPADGADELRLRKLWPGPLTALLTPNPDTPAEWTLEGRSVAVRVPDVDGLRRLLEALPGPLLSTSANRTGAPARGLSEARKLFPELEFLGFGGASAGSASTIVDCTVHPAKIVREGAVAF
jgi:L-threonylcarbamoyladenylate synthase